jgi:hypothetical protein
MAGAALDHLAPVSTVRYDSPSTSRRTVRAVGVVLVRAIMIVLAAALVLGIGWVGWQLLSTDPGRAANQQTDEGILTSSAKPVEDPGTSTIDQNFPVVSYRSYDPFGDDDDNGKPDKRKGRENDELTVTINDDDPDTAWLTEEYTTPLLDGKEGVGLILDLGAPKDVQEVTLSLVGKGSNVDVRVSDRILPDPALWAPLASAAGATSRIAVRAPRPVTGRYVLIWFTRVPPVEDATTGLYQGGVRSVTVTG